MTNITVFGKPRAFESYDYVFGGESSLPVENVHREPILKPKSYDDSVLHYFVKDNQAGLECYKRVRGYESDRDGIVFGVAIKSTTDFNIKETVFNVLKPFWEDFASAFLDGANRFNVPSIIEPLRGTQWSQEEIRKIQNVSNGKALRTADQNLLLLVAEDISSISTVEHIIKRFSDVYIANNVEIFKDPINDVVLKQTKKQIVAIDNGQLKVISDKIDTNVPDKKTKSPGTKCIFVWCPGGKKKGGNNAPKETTGTKGNGSKKVLLAVAIAAVAIIVVFVIVSVCRSNGTNETENETVPGPITPTNPEGETGQKEDEEIEIPMEPVPIEATSVRLNSYNRAIKERLALKPKILPEYSTNTLNEITYVVSDIMHVRIDHSARMLVVIERPDENTQVTVTAYIDGRELGQQTYTIAKKDEELVPPSDVPRKTRSQIPPFNGRPRTCAQYLSDLERALNNGSYTPEKVQEECQKIINGVYGSEHENNQDAVKLRDKAKSKNNQAKPGF